MKLDDIWGNEMAKRAVEIALKGHHSIKFIGGNEAELFHDFCIENDLLAFCLTPCPCGNFGDKDKACSCDPLELKKHKQGIEKIETALTIYTVRAKRLGKLPYELDKDSKQFLEQAMKMLKIGQKNILEVLEVAKTISTLDDSKEVKVQHIAEALQYRQKE